MAFLWKRHFFWLILSLMNQKFTKREKLKSRKQIQRLFSKNKHAFSFPVKVIWRPNDLPMDTARIQVLISVSKRNFKSAVDRNHLKRLIREAFRKNKAVLYPILDEKEMHIQLGFIYVSKDTLSYDEVEKAVVLCLGKIKESIV